MATKYYAVREGRTPGIYMNWADCKKMIDGYSGAVYKSFSTLAEAEAFCNGKVAEKEENNNYETYAFVDGSFNSATKVYGYGGFLVYDGKEYVLQGNGADEQMASMRNVAGEILGSMAAMQKALELGINEITILYDYMGIEQWATGSWKRNKEGTIQYYDFYQSIKDRLIVHFKKVAAHTGIDGNERADLLAKQAVGLEQ